MDGESIMKPSIKTNLTAITRDGGHYPLPPYLGESAVTSRDKH
jgi:hypothetical protein